MKLDMLGSAAAGTNARSGCSGYLIRSGTTQLLIDCGPGILPALKRLIDVRTIDAIVISHMHIDHILDLVPLRAAYRYAPVPFDRRVPLWLPPGGSDILDSLAAPLDLDQHSPLFFDQVFQTAEYNPFDTLQVGDIAIDFAPVHHPIPAWGMRISVTSSEWALGYTSDTGPITHLAAFLRGVDVLLCEATLLDSDISPTERGHMTAKEAGRLAQLCGARQLILTHTWDELPADQLLARAQEAFDGAVEIAWSGMEVEIP